MIKNFIIEDKNEQAYCFCELSIDEDELPFLNFNFGTADPSEMDFETLGRIIATAKKSTIPLYTTALENEEFYTIIDDVKITTLSEDIFDMSKPEYVELKQM